MNLKAAQNLPSQNNRDLGDSDKKANIFISGGPEKGERLNGAGKVLKNDG